MRPASFGRDGEIEAFIVDRYLESLLARRPTDPDGIPAGSAPIIEAWAQAHAATTRRLFRA